MTRTSVAGTATLLAALTGCALFRDDCEELCVSIATELDICEFDGAVTWADLGALGRDDFSRACMDEWQRSSRDLNSLELESALDVCVLSQEELALVVDCDLLVAMYGTQIAD